MEEILKLPGRELIGILTGGVSKERNPSLQSGESAKESLQRQGYTVKVIDTAEPTFLQQLRDIDVAFLAIAGQYAEDGKLQGTLETFGIPYTGSGVLASGLGMHKPMAKTIVQAAGLTVYKDVRIDPCQDVEAAAEKIFENLGLPVILKPESEGSSIGIEVAHSKSEIVDILRKSYLSNTRLMAEPFDNGRCLTVGVLDMGNGPVGLPPLEIKTLRKFFDHSAKQQAELRSFHCPADFPPDECKVLSDLALTAHNALGCSGYSRSDFIVSANGCAHWLEVNTLPSLKPTATLAKMAASAGVAYDRMIRHILEAGIRKEGYRP